MLTVLATVTMCPAAGNTLCWWAGGVGIPAAIQNLLNVTGMTILNNFTSSYGAQAVAAMGISQKYQYGAHAGGHGILPGNHAPDQLQLCQREP